MQDITKLLKSASWRLTLGRFADRLVVFAALGVGALALALLAQRFLGVAIAWRETALAVLAGALVCAALLALIRRPGPLQAARVLDDRAGLRETLSTAVCVASRDDAWSRAAVAHASSVAKGVSVRAALPVRAPRRWPAPVVAAAMLAAMWFTVPEVDALGLLQRAQAEEAEQQEVALAVSQVEQARESVREALEAAGAQDLLDELAKGDTPEGADPDAIRRLALRELTSVSERLNQLRDGERGVKMDSLRNAMQNIRRPGPGPLENTVRAMQRGDFAQASREMNELMRKLNDGELDEAQRQQLAEQLRNLSEQMNQLAQDSSQLERSLRDAGLDPALAQNPAALREALANAQGLTDAQRQQIEQAMRGLEGRRAAMEQLAQAMQQAAQACENPGAGGEGMQELAQQLSDMEMLAAEMARLEAAMGDVWGQFAELAAGQGEGEGGSGSEVDMLELWDRQRPGGGAGTGAGFGLSDAQGPSEPPFPYDTQRERSPGEMRAGPIIATRLVEGAQVRGEARAEFQEVVTAASQDAADAIESQRIPREYHEAVKHYFGRLESRAKGERPAQEGDKPEGGQQ